MGTNYTWRFNTCACCGRFDQAHVGKQAAGWSFHFRAWPHRLMNVDYPQWGHEPVSPFGFPVVSRADWRRVFTGVPGELWDEYGCRVEDPVAWLDALPPASKEQVEWEDTRLRSNPIVDPSPEREWRDPEGFCFYAGEFA